MTTEPFFTVDQGRRLADIILRVNWKYLDALEKTAKDDQVERGYVSMRMTEIQKLWNDEIATTCQEMMAHMSGMVAEFQRIATEALAVAPQPKYIVLKDADL